MSAAWRGPLPALILGLGLPGGAVAPRLEGRRLDGRACDLEQQRGKVVLLLLWSTSCELSGEVLRELRARRSEWRRRKSVAVLTVATDARREEVLDAERRLGLAAAGMITLWRHEPGHRDGFGQPAQLPASFLIDSEGRLVERHLGRLPAEIWSRIAALSA